MQPVQPVQPLLRVPHPVPRRPLRAPAPRPELERGRVQARAGALPRGLAAVQPPSPEQVPRPAPRAVRTCRSEEGRRSDRPSWAHPGAWRARTASPRTSTCLPVAGLRARPRPVPPIPSSASGARTSRGGRCRWRRPPPSQVGARASSPRRRVQVLVPWASVREQPPRASARPRLRVPAQRQEQREPPALERVMVRRSRASESRWPWLERARQEERAYSASRAWVRPRLLEHRSVRRLRSALREAPWHRSVPRLRSVLPEAPWQRPWLEAACSRPPAWGSVAQRALSQRLKGSQRASAPPVRPAPDREAGSRRRPRRLRSRRPLPRTERRSGGASGSPRCSREPRCRTSPHLAGSRPGGRGVPRSRAWGTGRGQAALISRRAVAAEATNPLPTRPLEALPG